MKDTVVADITPSTPQTGKSAERGLYHYTDLPHLLGILRSGVIEPRTKSAWYNPCGVPPLVWASSATPWEVICTATLAIGPDGELPPGTVPGHPYEAARIRIPHDFSEEWDVAMAKCGSQWFTIMRLAQAGYEQNSNPRHWCACRRPVPAELWLSVELWDGGAWQCLPRKSRVYTTSDLDAFLTCLCEQ